MRNRAEIGKREVFLKIHLTADCVTSHRVQRKKQQGDKEPHAYTAYCVRAVIGTVHRLGRHTGIINDLQLCVTDDISGNRLIIIDYCLQDIICILRLCRCDSDRKYGAVLERLRRNRAIQRIHPKIRLDHFL